MFYFNGTPVAVLDPISEGNIPSTDRGALEIAGSAKAEMRLTDLSQNYPKGRYRWITDEDEVRLERLVDTQHPRMAIEATSWEGDVEVLIKVLPTGEVVFNVEESELTELLEQLEYELDQLHDLARMVLED